MKYATMITDTQELYEYHQMSDCPAGYNWGIPNCYSVQGAGKFYDIVSIDEFEDSCELVMHIVDQMDADDAHTIRFDMHQPIDWHPCPSITIHVTDPEDSTAEWFVKCTGVGHDTPFDETYFECRDFLTELAGRGEDDYTWGRLGALLAKRGWFCEEFEFDHVLYF